MSSPEHARLMAAYNRWQNHNLYSAASALGDAARRADRGAFFGSIHKTLSHILWSDEIWLSRFTDFPPLRGGADLGGSANYYPDWDELCAAREKTDRAIIEWAAALKEEDFAGELTWYSGAMKRDVTRPRALLIAHIFNHQTHHRGQVHAMLTAAGAKPGDTDIPFMPGLAQGAAASRS